MSSNDADSGKAGDVTQPKQRLNSYSAAAASKPAENVTKENQGDGLSRSRSGSKKSTSDGQNKRNQRNSVTDGKNQQQRNRAQSNSFKNQSQAAGDRRNSNRNNGPNKQRSVDTKNDKRRVLSSTGRSFEENPHGEKKERLRSTNCN